MATELRSAIAAAARQLGINPIDLATAISYETGGTFNPTIKGPTTKWGTHEGLLQWGDPQAAKYINNDYSIPSQMRGAVAYLKDAGVKPGMGLPDIYSAINAGRVGRYGASDAAAGGAPGTVMDKVQGMGGHRQKAAALMSALGPGDMPPPSLSGIGSPNVPSPGSDSLMGGAGSDNLGSGLGMTPEEAADMAALLQKKERRRGNPFEGLDFGFAEAPRISGGGGDARSTGNMLLEALNAPTAADMLLRKRLQGIR